MYNECEERGRKESLKRQLSPRLFNNETEREDISMSNETKFFTYKGYPLVRNKGTIYFGNMSDEYVIMMQLSNTEAVGDIKVAKKVKIFRMKTDESLPADKRVDKTAEKTSLYEALDIAAAWLKIKPNAV